MAIQAAEELAHSRRSNGSVLTIGTFDGVHRGHQYVIRQVVECARSRGLESAVITFRLSPRAVLRPDRPVLYLSDLDERVDLVKALGVDHVIPLTFDVPLSNLGAREFMALLWGHLSVRHLVVGPDFALGHNREGTLPVLAALGQEMGFTVEALQPLRNDGDRISSSAIRRAIAAGDIESAMDMLGRPYVLHGPVVEGHRRGKGLGFPTANVAIGKHRSIPADGVYVTRVYLDGEVHPSVTNIGDNPTFGDADRAVEVYILDFDRTIYGHQLGVEMVHRLRGEERFPSVEALVAQIKRDVEEARAYLRR